MSSAILTISSTVLGKDHFAEIFPRTAGNVGGGEDLEKPLNFAHGVFCQLARCGEQDGGAESGPCSA